MIYVFLSDDPLTLRECISEEQASTLSWDNYFLYIRNPRMEGPKTKCSYKWKIDKWLRSI